MDCLIRVVWDVSGLKIGQINWTNFITVDRALTLCHVRLLIYMMMKKLKPGEKYEEWTEPAL